MGGKGTGDPGHDSRDGPDDRESRNNSRLEHFIRTLSDENEESRWKSAEAPGRVGDPRAMDDLIGTLWDDDARVRFKAVWALGRIAEKRAYAPLQRLTGWRMKKPGR